MSENRPQLADTEAPLTGARFLVIASQFNGDIVAELKAGAVERLQLAGVTVEEIPVPGALEIPVAAAIKLDQGKYDGVVAVGCVIRGETEHFEIVAHQSARALMDLAVAHRIALGNGILTVETEAQAWTRAKRSEGNAGGHAAAAALALARLARKV
ncbi:MAG TPA: 6,7-dimethyl-8-ribityllumazine synthase [Xanthobacteraceae bacterium]|jgi:6,7-dimethyl-8-ribityllumazine synthase|nr:6,7-dimethyl-8-ribityllumazine synthase [Xanthobacteraceae bacterium]